MSMPGPISTPAMPATYQYLKFVAARVPPMAPPTTEMTSQVMKLTPRLLKPGRKPESPNAGNTEVHTSTISPIVWRAFILRTGRGLYCIIFSLYTVILKRCLLICKQAPSLFIIRQIYYHTFFLACFTSLPSLERKVLQLMGLKL